MRTTPFKRGETEVRPLVAAMDRQGEIPRALVDALFALGVMGIEIPTAHGGGGGSFFMAVLAIEELARVDPAVAVCADVQNALVNQRIDNVRMVMDRMFFLDESKLVDRGDMERRPGGITGHSPWVLTAFRIRPTL